MLVMCFDFFGDEWVHSEYQGKKWDRCYAILLPELNNVLWHLKIVMTNLNEICGNKMEK